MKRLLLAAALVVPIILALAWVAWFSPWVAVTTVDVRVSSAPDVAGPFTGEEVASAASVEIGTPLLRVPADEIEQRIGALPQVESVTVSRAWPDTLVIDVTRRVPVALVASGSGYDVVDGQGVVIRTIATQDEGVPLVLAVGDGRSAAVSVAQQLPAWLRDKVVSIDGSTRNDVTLRLRNGATVMWGSADDSEFKARVLQTLLQVDAKYYDVAAPGVPATSDTPPR